MDIDIDDLRRAPEPDDVECGACGEPAITAIKFDHLTPESEERYGFCAEHMPNSQEELDIVAEAIKVRIDPFKVIDQMGVDSMSYERILEELRGSRVYADAAEDFDDSQEPGDGRTLDELF